MESCDTMENKPKKFLFARKGAKTTPIAIDFYTKRFDSYPDELVSFAKDHDISLLPLTSLKG